MNKKQFSQILNSALYSFEGISENEMVLTMGLNPELVRVGIELCNYLKKIEVKGGSD